MRKQRRATPEADQQEALFLWRGLWKGRYPEMKWLHASLNGVPLPVSTARKASKQGMTAGIWDVFLPVPQVPIGGGDPNLWPTYNYGGLYIEMKAGKNGLTSEQAKFQEDNLGRYRFAVCHTWTEAAQVIGDYLGWDKDHPALRGIR
jgi:hypothetical protein